MRGQVARGYGPEGGWVNVFRWDAIPMHWRLYKGTLASGDTRRVADNSSFGLQIGPLDDQVHTLGVQIDVHGAQRWAPPSPVNRTYSVKVKFCTEKLRNIYGEREWGGARSRRRRRARAYDRKNTKRCTAICVLPRLKRINELV